MTTALLAWLDAGCPPRDPLRYDAAWLVWIADRWRVAALGIPSVFS